MKSIYQKLLSGIPDYKEFLTVDEMDESSRRLAAEHPDCVELFEMGKTRQGHPLLCLKIGSGSRNALMFGCPHPNEPIGTMMLEYFTKNLAENKELRDELDYTWYIVKAWDADGLRLNEKWLKGPYTLYNYSRNFFRPAGHKQVDWTFPVDYKELHFHDTIPESEAMMKLIDDIKPSFIYSLHNAGFGGVYWYITKPMPEIYEEMYAAANSQQVPINFGEPESPSCVAFAPAIYANLGIETEYDYLEKYGGGINPADVIGSGDCSSSYAGARYDSFTLLTEMPYFYDERIKDMSESDTVRRDAALQKLDWQDRTSAFLRETLAISQQYMDPENPFMLAVKAFTKGGSSDATRKMIAENPDFAKKATVAEKFDNLCASKFYKYLSYGQLLRANETELEKMDKAGEQNPEKRAALQKAFDIMVKAHKDMTDELESEINYQVVPIRKLVYIQLAWGMMTAEYL